MTSIDKAEARAPSEGRSRRERLEDFWELKLVFGARWLLAPAYGILILALIVLAYKTGEEFYELIRNWNNTNEAKAITQVLVIVDIVLVMNLVLMVLFVGYKNFVSDIDFDKFGENPDAPHWLGKLGYSGLKIQLLGSVIAISVIFLLRMFVDLIDSDHFDVTKVVLLLSLHLTFVFSALILAIVNRLKDGSGGEEKVSATG